MELPSHAALGTAVRAARKRAAWSQQELADRSGVSRVLVARVERGLANPTWETVLRLGAVLDMRFDATWTDEPTPRQLQARLRQRPAQAGESQKDSNRSLTTGKTVAVAGQAAATVEVLTRAEGIVLPGPVDLAQLVARTRKT